MEVACKEYDTKTLGQRHKKRPGVRQQIKDLRKERINYDHRRLRWMSIGPLYKFKRPRQHQQFAEQACKQDLRFVYHGAKRSRMMKTTSNLRDSAVKFQTLERQPLLQKDEDKRKSVLGASTTIAEWVWSHV